MPSRKKKQQKNNQNSTKVASSTTDNAGASNQAATDPSASTSASAASLPQSTTTSTQAADSQNLKDSNSNNATSAGNSTKESGEGSIKSVRKSWYGGGSWRSKAAPIAQVAKESIGVAQGSTTELPAGQTRRQEVLPSESGTSSPARYLTGSMRRGSKGNPATASTTKLNVTFDGATTSQSSQAKDEAPPAEPPLPPDPSVEGNKVAGKEDGKRKQTAESAGGFTSRWHGWWSRPDEQPKQQQSSNLVSDDASNTPLPGPTPSEEPKDGILEQSAQSAKTAGESSEQEATGSEEKSNQPQSWFWFWSKAQNAKDEQEDNKVTTDQAPQTETASAPDTKSAPDQPKPEDLKSEDPPTKEIPAKASAWAFWSREKTQPTDKDGRPSDEPHKYVGELAVADTPSQSHPEAAQFNEQKEQEEALPEAPKKNSRLLLIKDGSSRSSSAKSTPAQSPARKPAEETKSLKESPEPRNLVLPKFSDTYPPLRSQSYWQIIRKYFLGDDQSTPHLTINNSPPRIRKALAIGVHGYFPAAIVQRVIGQPTGTSIRFANSAAAAIRQWTAARGTTDVEIETVALEGEGVIEDRVNALWKLLLNWINQIRKADFIFVACHSQGVPVAIMLVAKLIAFGCISPSTRIGICAMAGVNLGPFTNYQSRFLDRSAGELFEFAKPDSKVSQTYQKAMEEVLRAGVRVLYVGSIDDQLVSLESSTFSTLSHPYIYRAVFVDGRIHAPDFLTRLISLTFKLRNLGLPDHGLIRELSPALAGSLYSGEGHSRIYEEDACYTLAIQHALETASLPNNSNIPLRNSLQGQEMSKADGNKTGGDQPAGSGVAAPAGSNPFFLPWAMRGLLEEEKVRKELGDEVQELLRLFENWKPVSKPLKDVRFRLEAVRSKL